MTEIIRNLFSLRSREVRPIFETIYLKSSYPKLFQQYGKLYLVIGGEHSLKSIMIPAEKVVGFVPFIVDLRLVINNMFPQANVDVRSNVPKNYVTSGVMPLVYKLEFTVYY